MFGSEPSPVDILLVDDNPAKILALETALAPLGQNLVPALGGREALRQLMARRFATIILDVNMPDLDGFETAQMIRARRQSEHTPIIFVSAISLDGKDALRGYSLGAVDYIFAPIIPEVLRAKVSVFVELHRKTEEARVHAARLEERTRELERSQQQLRQAERMAMLGTLCAGLGHDMGNLLLPIVTRLETLPADGLTPEAAEIIDSIRTCVAYLRRLSSGLRLLALDPERNDVAPETTALPEWWTETEAIYRNALPRGVALERALGEGLPPLRIGRHQLTQAVFNLVQNAGEAAAESPGAVVRVGAEPGPDAETVRLTVSDNGAGMPPEVLQRCFDPFFTTKTRSISTGLGLTLVHGIVRNAGGSISVASEPGRGTTFSIHLPVGAKDAGAGRGVAVVSLSDPRLRGYAASVARMSGFEVVQAGPDDEPAPDARVWIADGGVDRGRLRAFLERDGGRRVLLAGPEGEAAARETRVLGFTASDGPRSLRKRLGELDAGLARPAHAGGLTT